MEAEYMALTEATKELLWIRGFLTELGYGNDNPTNLFTDNKSALALAKNPVSHARAKHIDVRHHFVRDAIRTMSFGCSISLRKICADSLTKALGREKHWKCTTRMGMCYASSVGVICLGIISFIIHWHRDI